MGIKKIYFDNRWIGSHGIGRFSKMLSLHIPMIKMNILGSPTSIFDPILFSIQALFLPSDAIVFSPGFNAPIFIRQKFIFTLHDLNHIDRSENSSFLKSLYYKFVILRAIKFSYKVLTVSEFSKNRIVTWSNANPNKIINVGNGVDEFFTSNNLVRIIESRYFLCVSNRKLHKNEFRLIKAFSLANIDNDICLVFTGFVTTEVKIFCNSIGILDRIIFLGIIPDSDFPALYSGSLGLLFPSLYEGFGLPVIEAMACGTPVLTSNISSLPEVAGNAALLVNPHSIDDIRFGIERLVNDAEFRASLSALGLERSKLFRWDRVASKVAEALGCNSNEI